MSSSVLGSKTRARERPVPGWVIRMVDIIDKVNETVGNVVSFAVLFIMLIQVMDVVLRYVFRSPTIWAWDVNGQLFTATAILAGGYALQHRTHVSMDILYSRVHPRVQRVFDAISVPLVLMAFAIVIWKGGEMGWTAWSTGARGRSYFSPILWPVRSTLFVGGVLIFLQAISNYTRTFLGLERETAGGLVSVVAEAQADVREVEA